MTHDLTTLRQTVAVLTRKAQENGGLSGAERTRLDMALNTLEVSEKIQKEVEAGYQPVAA